MEKNNYRLLYKQNQTPDNFPSTVFESNEHGPAFPVFVGFTTARL